MKAEPELTHDGDVTWIRVGGHAQSAVSLDDPELLVFEYVQHLALAVDALFPRPTPLRVTHVGGAGLTLARWVHATRPGSPQIVLEPDVAMTELVRRELPLPRGHRIRVRPVSGEEGVAGLRSASADLVVLDAYAGARVPPGLTTVEWLGEVSRVLVPEGVFLANLGDRPGLRYAARVASGVRAALGPVADGKGARTAYVGLHHTLKGKGFGNVVLVASRRPLPLFEMRRATARLAIPTGVVAPDEVLARSGGAYPFSAELGDVSWSPAPPD
ncbi:spermidine synthase [Knoellia remsis]|uniref:Spermidine synthase n=1 Tax=Knoellia remsis TaxID=407159 RepID=A0A2T0UJR7_9MICO|nr:fused MFS/spermidine synthase [Knoellia remsis]PRY58191.1 spermidine synthase [Knoellia remsis]